jgi:broad specificity phosphatase PhoE
MSLTKEQLAEWAQREAEYYADAEKWKRVQERMKREQAELEAEWKQRDILLFNQHKYTQQEINEAIHQIRIDRLKIILNPYNPLS